MPDIFRNLREKGVQFNPQGLRLSHAGSEVGVAKEYADGYMYGVLALPFARPQPDHNNGECVQNIDNAGMTYCFYSYLLWLLFCRCR